MKRKREKKSNNDTNRAKQTVVTLTSEVHVNRDVNLFTEVQTANRKSEKSRHSISELNDLHALCFVFVTSSLMNVKMKIGKLLCLFRMHIECVHFMRLSLSVVFFFSCCK